ncbi:hypothetical protein ALC57_10262 [Trachymyrmex cornetzi]|uniref:Uncharacterized protein n=1 Tax=Trachymyrmex cornetzi TaxID=471704 RepID=A0A195DX46_9HYME|nr:hypothetical protein ALC57_10262 [Trachymyrmex cornetzi]
MLVVKMRSKKREVGAWRGCAEDGRGWHKGWMEMRDGPREGDLDGRERQRFQSERVRETAPSKGGLGDARGKDPPTQESRPLFGFKQGKGCKTRRELSGRGRGPGGRGRARSRWRTHTEGARSGGLIRRRCAVEKKGCFPSGRRRRPERVRSSEWFSDEGEKRAREKTRRRKSIGGRWKEKRGGRRTGGGKVTRWKGGGSRRVEGGWVAASKGCWGGGTGGNPGG